MAAGFVQGKEGLEPLGLAEGGCCGTSLRCATVRTKGVAMDTLVMFIGVMLVILIGGLFVYKNT